MSKAAIIQAVKALDLAAAKRLLETKPALLTVTDRDERNLLHLASSVDNDELRLPSRTQIQLVKFLLDRVFEIDLPVGRDKCTPLFFAVARAKNPALVKFLLDGGAKPSNAPGGGLVLETLRRGERPSPSTAPT